MIEEVISTVFEVMIDNKKKPWNFTNKVSLQEKWKMN